MERARGQRDLGEAWLSPKLGRNARLERLEGVFDWSAMERLLSRVHAGKTGRPAWPSLVMLKALLLQQWYGLSDPGLEEALGDRLSFRRFVGLSSDEGAPDHSVISRFRKALREHGLDKQLFDEVQHQLEARGLVVRQGTLLDATVVAAAVKKPGSPAGSGSKTDPDAGWTRKGGQSTFGYKAYEHKGRRARLKGAGVKDRIMHRSHKNQPALPHWQQVRNRLISPIRSAVERVFGTLKRTYGYRRVRYVGLAANTTHLRLLCIAFNLRKAEALTT